MSSHDLSSSFIIRRLPNGCLIEFNSCCLDDASSHGLAEQLLAAALDCTGRTLYLNFNHVSVVARSVWLQLLALHQELQEENRRLCLLNLMPELKEQLHAVERAELEEVAVTRECLCD
jgi:anti-anti-sigma regulatory factor